MIILSSPLGHMQALKGDGNQADVHLELSLGYWEMHDLAAAEEQNRAVLRFDRGQSDALYNLGAIYANRGDKIQARRYWMDAVRLGGKSDGAEKSRLALERLNGTR
jgi:Tfp pilus assembly protein PilF